MTDVFGPYHFVPLSKWVYQPEWAHLVSHDHPLEKGLSGRVKLTLRACSPLCVGGPREKNSYEVRWLRDPNGKPIIPGTSVKGMLRSVLEIATFAKFQAVDDARYSFRRVPPNQDYSNEVYFKNVTPVWLKYNKDENRWEIRQCKMAKIKLAELARLTKKALKNNSPLLKKYEQLGINREVFVSNAPMENNPSAYVSEPRFESYSEAKGGHVVFSSFRPGNVPETEFAYFFYDVELDVKVCEIKKKLEFAYAHRSEELENLFNKNQHPTYGLPLFAVYDDSGEIKHIGLTKGVRVIFKNSVGELVNNFYDIPPEESLSEHYLLDFPELVFGTVGKFYSLRSRVFFTDCVANKEYQSDFLNNVVLSSPKPTFTKFYLENQNGRTVSYQDDKAIPSGWKRYIAKYSKPAELVQQPNHKNRDISSDLEYIEKGAEFSGEFVFHNLTEVELGGLLWAIQMGGEHGSVHSLGTGKPLGLGLVELNTELQEVYCNDGSTLDPNIKPLVQNFVEHMNRVHPGEACNSWEQSPQIQHLVAISMPKDNTKTKVQYMSLEKHKRAKGLPKFRDLTRDEKLPKSSLSGKKNRPKGRLAQILEQYESEKTEVNEEISVQPAVVEELQSIQPKGDEMLHILKAELGYSQPHNTPELIRKFIVKAMQFDSIEFTDNVISEFKKLVVEHKFGKTKNKKRAALDMELFNELMAKFNHK